MLVTSLEKRYLRDVSCCSFIVLFFRIANTRHAVKDQIVGVYHYDPPNENKLKVLLCIIGILGLILLAYSLTNTNSNFQFHLSDFKKYVRTVRGEKYQSPYLAATLKELLRVVTVCTQHLCPIIVCEDKANFISTTKRNTTKQFH